MYAHFSFLGGMEKIKQHTFALAHYTYTVLSNLKYANGAPVVRIYSDTDFSNPDVQGPIINFNVLDENGEVLGFSQVCFFSCLNLTLWLYFKHVHDEFFVLKEICYSQ